VLPLVGGGGSGVPRPQALELEVGGAGGARLVVTADVAWAVVVTREPTDAAQETGVAVAEIGTAAFLPAPPEPDPERSLL
jgi:hypothetical protein